MNRYFYIDTAGKQKGAFTAIELKEENIKRDTLVWTQGMEQWKRADEIDELRHLFSETYQAPPPSDPSSSSAAGYAKDLVGRVNFGDHHTLHALW